MDTADFHFLAAMVKKTSGLVLSEDKAYLLETRLLPVARRAGLKTIDQLVAAAQKPNAQAITDEITDAMTTNESLFFRDMKPFEQFEQHVMPRLMKARESRKALRIWSAASSSGQEPYSLAIILKEMGAALAGWKVEIIATDLSKEMLEKARSGIYTQFEVQRGLPIAKLVKYFKQVGDKWQIDSSIRAMVRFGQFNLLQDPSPLGRFDVVFCRNVLIYFDQPTKTQVLDGISKLLAPDGVLYLGGAETVLGVTDKFKPVSGQRGMYAHVDNADSLAVSA